MSLSKSLGAYSDVRAVLDQALSRGGAKYRLPTKGKAIHWRHRANAFRRLLEKTIKDQAVLLPLSSQESPYDSLQFIIDDADPCVIIIKPRDFGVLEALDGEVLEPKIVETDPLMLEAEEFARKLREG